MIDPISLGMFLGKNWKKIALGFLVVLAFTSAALAQKYTKLTGALEQCNLASMAQEQKIEALSKALAEAKAGGNFEFEMDPGTFRPGECPPCPKIKFKGDFFAGAAAGTSSTAGVTENPEKPMALQYKPYTWAVALGGGGGMSVAGDTIWHGSAAVDYHNLRAYGTYATDKSWTAGGQVILLRGNWP